jgi:Chaperone of endosialidase
MAVNLPTMKSLPSTVSSPQPIFPSGTSGGGTPAATSTSQSTATSGAYPVGSKYTPGSFTYTSGTGTAYGLTKTDAGNGNSYYEYPDGSRTLVGPDGTVLGNQAPSTPTPGGTPSSTGGPPPQLPPGWDPTKGTSVNSDGTIRNADYGTNSDGTVEASNAQGVQQALAAGYPLNKIRVPVVSDGFNGGPPTTTYTTADKGGILDPTDGKTHTLSSTGVEGGTPAPKNLLDALGSGVPFVSPVLAAGTGLVTDVANKVKGLLPTTSGGGAAPTVANGPAIAAAINAAQNQADAAQNAANNYQPISSPTIGYAPAAQAGHATAGVSQGYGATGGVSQGYAAAAGQVGAYQAAPYTAPIQAGHATAGVATAAQIASTALAAKQQAIVAQQIQAALVAQQPAIQAQQVTAAQAGRTIVGPTALADQSQIAPVDLAGNTTIDQGESEQARAAQTNLIGQLQGTIAGTSPSVAAIMLRQETERNIASQYALGAAASAQNSGLAQRTAMINAANLNQQAIGQQALLRAQEIATAQGLLGTTAGAERTSDINVATSQADLSQQVILANAGFTNTQNMTQAQLDQAVKLANAGFKNTATTTQAQLDQATAALNVTQANTVNLANAKNALDAATTNVTLAQQAMLANQSAENAARLANAQNALAAATTNAQLAQQVELQNAAAINQTNTTNATLSTNTSIANAGYATQASITNANNVTSANTASAQLANAISIANANNQSQMQVSQAADTTNANIATAGNFTQSSVANAKNATDASIASAQNYTSSSENNATNATNASDVTSTNETNASINTATLANAVNINNAANAVTTTGQNITAKQDAAGNAITAEGNVISGQVGMANAANGAVTAAANMKTANNGDPSNPFNIIKNIPVPGSDRRGKKDIKDAEMDVKKLVASLSAKSFAYKDTSKPGTAPGRRWGVMAQDLEKTSAGKSLVMETPTGKMIDASQAVMTALAALGHVAKRLDKVEKRVSR